MLSSQGYVMTVTQAAGMAGRPKSLLMPGSGLPLARGSTGRSSNTSLGVDSTPSTHSQGSSEPEEDKLADLETALWWDGFNTLRSARKHYPNHNGNNYHHQTPSPRSPSSPLSPSAPDYWAQTNGSVSPPNNMRQLQEMCITPRSRFNTVSGNRKTRHDSRALSKSCDSGMTRNWGLSKGEDLSYTHPPNPYHRTNGHAVEERVFPGIGSEMALEAFRNRSLSAGDKISSSPNPPHIQYVNKGHNSYPATPSSYPGTPRNGFHPTTSPPPSPAGDAPSSPRKSLWIKLNLQTISEKIFRPGKRSKSKSKPAPSEEKFKRSSSVPNMLDERTDDDSDTDNDDYGFLSYPGLVFHTPLTQGGSCSMPVTPSSAPAPIGMQKAKSPTSPSRAPRLNLNPKKWRKSKLPKSPSLWSPEGSCCWSSTSGQKLTVTDTSLLSLTDVERVALQKIALTKLQSLNLGCAITIPKEWKRSKRGGFTLKRRTGSTSLLDNLKDRGKDKDSKDPGGTGWVFGIPLGKCIANDIDLRRRKPSLLRERRESLDIPQFHRPSRKSSSSSGGAISSDSLSESDTKSGSNLLDALSLQSPSTTTLGNVRKYSIDHSLTHHAPQVPYIINACCKHLETYGLRVLGIFRIGSSKKRVRQLRDEIDSGKDIKLNEEHSPHDVGALLKEFFRELPNPLLTKDLYSAFVASRKLKSEKQRLWTLTLLVSLLPLTNRDTLWSLLRFLSLVAQHSTDSVDENGVTLPGNKMDAHNLATLFGPNIIHKAKGGEFQVECPERADERDDVIGVVEEMISSYHPIFVIPAELHDEVLRLLKETNPEAVDILLKQRVSAQSPVDTELESSSVFEGSDSSSIPQSPTYGSEPEGVLVQGAGPAYSTHCRQPSQPRFSAKHRYSDVSLSTQMDMSPRPTSTYRLSVPSQDWYKPGRSISPASPRVSPSPKAMKSATPEPMIRVTGGTPERSTPSQGGLASPPASHIRRSLGVPHGPGPARMAQQTQKHTLSVPTGRSSKDSVDSKSNSSLSSGYYAGSSRSGTNSPVTPDPPQGARWFTGTPPESPRGRPHHTTEHSQDHTHFHRTSSQQRPLGVSQTNLGQPSSPPHSLGHGRTHHGFIPNRSQYNERWRQWETITRQHSDDFQEHETLV